MLLVAQAIFEWLGTTNKPPGAVEHDAEARWWNDLRAVGPHSCQSSASTMKPENRTFIISGGCSGLGLATARDLHAAGGYVSLLDLNADAGAELVREFGSRARFFETDVSSTESVQVAVEGTAAWIKESGMELGGVVAAAGVGAAQKVCSTLTKTLS